MTAPRQRRRRRLVVERGHGAPVEPLDDFLAAGPLGWRVEAREAVDGTRWANQESPMIEEAKGNLLEADAEALVNTVNTVGHMGKGIALQFKQTYPENFLAYARAMKRGEVRTGRMFVVPTGFVTNPRYIINFPTKRHWRGRSRIEDIEAGLEALVGEIRRLGIRSIAVPPLGCGNGGLDWRDVEPRIKRALADLPDVRVRSPTSKSAC